MSLFRPGYILDKFSPKFENKQLNAEQISLIKFEPNRDVHIKVTMRTEYGDRYRLFVIDKKSFENQYSLEDAGITLKNIDGRITVDNLKWNGIAKKMGMSQVFDENGFAVPVTILQAGPCRVTQVKTIDNDGYDAVQIAYGNKKDKNTNKPLKGHFKKAGVKPASFLVPISILII